MKRNQGGGIEDNSSITPAQRRSDCLCMNQEGNNNNKKTYQCKTECISLRQKDIGNETGESTKPGGMVHAAFRIPADMQSVNILLGGVILGFGTFVFL